jgi:hypothetical protein
VLSPLLFLASIAQAEEGLQRIALVAGTNDGGSERVALRYAETDAQSMAAVLHDLGGVSRDDIVLLLGPTKADLVRGFEQLNAKIRAAGARTEVIIYYSGHSDEDGLLLGEQEYSYSDLRAQIAGLPADVRIAVLDSCASGALVRTKGGVHLPAFLLDESIDVRGTAILTSSAADESAQEADRIASSYFTHYLVSGLRGAADVTGDGRVTLNEAYRYAFDETLQRTETTGHGAQHPSYDINLSGTGDLVMTDVKEASAVLVVPESVEGRVFVRDPNGKLIAEVYSPGGRVIELGLEEGHYDVVIERDTRRLMTGAIDLAKGSRLELSFDGLAIAEREPTYARGDVDLKPVYFAAALFPTIGTNGVGEDTVVYSSLNLLVGKNHTVHGVEIGGVANLLTGDQEGFEVAGVGNGIRGYSRGMVVGGAFNAIGQDAIGFYPAGAVNVVGNDSTSWLVAGGLNAVGGNAYGSQMAGGVNLIEKDAKGFLVAGGANVVGGDSIGWHAAGGLDLVGKSMKGLQTAPINVAKDLTGAQIGVINVAGNATGAQIGVINVAKKLDGAPIGVINIIGDGMHDVAVWTSETTQGTVGVKLGSRSVYTILGFGGSSYKTGYWSTVGGIGGHKGFGDAWVELDGLVQDINHGPLFTERNQEPLLTSARLGVGYNVVDRFAPFVGLSYNLSIPIDGVAYADPISPVHGSQWGNSNVTWWPGFFAGVQY